MLRHVLLQEVGELRLLCLLKPAHQDKVFPLATQTLLLLLLVLLLLLLLKHVLF